MKVQLENKSELERKLNIEVPAEIVNNFFKKATVKAQKESNLKGFRPGKAPLDTVKKVYSDSILRWVADDLINTHFVKGIIEHKVQMAGEPEFEFGWPKEGEAFEFSAFFEVYPEVKVTRFEGLEAEKLQTEVTPSSIDSTIERLRSSWAEWNLVEREVKNGDQVTVDFKGQIDSKPDPRLEGEGMPVEIGAGQMIQGFESGLEGMKEGEEKTLNLMFPEEYHAPDFSGKAVEFKVTVKAVKEKTLPSLDEAFAKRFGKESMDELKEMIEKDLVQRIEKESKNHLEETLIRSLVQANPIEVPQFFVKRQKDSMVKNFEKDWKQKGQPDEAIAAYIQKWDSDFDKLAKEMIQAEFLVMELAKNQNLEANEEDFKKKLEEYAVQTGIELNRVIEHYSAENRKNQLLSTLTREKVVKFLEEKAQIKNIDKIKEENSEEQITELN